MYLVDKLATFLLKFVVASYTKIMEMEGPPSLGRKSIFQLSASKTHPNESFSESTSIFKNILAKLPVAKHGWHCNIQNKLLVQLTFIDHTSNITLLLGCFVC